MSDQPEMGVLVRRNPYIRLTSNYCLVAGRGSYTPSPLMPAMGSSFGIRPSHSGSMGASPQAVVSDLNGSHLQRMGINAKIHLAPLATVLGPMFLANLRRACARQPTSVTP